MCPFRKMHNSKDIVDILEQDYYSFRFYAHSEKLLVWLSQFTQGLKMLNCKWSKC